MILNSNRAIVSTINWNAVTYAFVFGHVDVLRHLNQNADKYDLRKCFSIPEIYGDESKEEFNAFYELDPTA